MKFNFAIGKKIRLVHLDGRSIFSVFGIVIKRFHGAWLITNKYEEGE